MNVTWRDVLSVCFMVLVALVIFFLFAKFVLQRSFVAIHFFSVNIAFFIVLFAGWSVIIIQYVRDQG